jgi:glycosyltransferase involved in cell wall biosynthesis
LASNEVDDLSRRTIKAKSSALAGKSIVIVTPSNWLAAKARESQLFRSMEVVVIPNGIDTNKFKPKTQKANQNQGKKNSEISVLLCGAQNLKDSRKGYDLFIQAIEMVDFECLLVTFGPKPDWIINNPKVKQQHLGILHSEDQLIDAYRMADVFICPSREDNLPNTVLEAMACGTPCVGFNTGGLSDLVDHKVNGWLAEPFDTRSLIAGVEWVLNNSNTQEPQTQARNKIVDRFEIRNTSKQYCQLYEDVYNRYIAKKP